MFQKTIKITRCYRKYDDGKVVEETVEVTGDSDKVKMDQAFKKMDEIFDKMDELFKDMF